ncbi:MAG: hypothetical protein ACD_58C00041G0006 [uncultured bacterium]|nr:MAG: hypothetical protein ACD_58C00041G0006 [uncultured bacterium]
MATIRKDQLEKNHIYHVFNRSIAGYIIFNSHGEFNRIIKLIKLCRYNNFNHRFSQFIDLDAFTQISIIDQLYKENDVMVEIIAHCIMPTHIHLLLKQITDNGITKFMGKVLNSYSKYFNTKHQRTGPLWSGRFKNVLVKNDKQLLHLTRYIHLNPTSANLCRNPEDWAFSSYLEYIKLVKDNKRLCKFKDLIDILPDEYTNFVNDRKSYQQELSIIKNQLIDNYSG